jgi:hypothetical protein
MVPPEPATQGKIVVVFVAPGENGGPNKIVSELEFVVDVPPVRGGQ